MLWSKAIGAGSVGGSIALEFVTSAGTSGVQTITIPPLAAAGDLAVIFCSSVVGTLPTVTGWTTISSTGASVYNLRCLYKILTADDLGDTLTVASPTSTAGFAMIDMLVFRASGGTLDLANIVSLTAVGDNQTKTAQTVNATAEPSPNLILSVTSAYQANWTSYSFIYTDVYWDGGLFRTATQGKQAVVYEIQNDYNTSRTVNLSSYTSQYQSFHSFAVNFS